MQCPWLVLLAYLVLLLHLLSALAFEATMLHGLHLMAPHGMSGAASSRQHPSPRPVLLGVVGLTTSPQKIAFAFFLTNPPQFFTLREECPFLYLVSTPHFPPICPNFPPFPPIFPLDIGDPPPTPIYLPKMAFFGSSH